MHFGWFYINLGVWERWFNFYLFLHFGWWVDAFLSRFFFFLLYINNSVPLLLILCLASSNQLFNRCNRTPSSTFTVFFYFVFVNPCMLLLSCFLLFFLPWIFYFALHFPFKNPSCFFLFLFLFLQFFYIFFFCLFCLIFYRLTSGEDRINFLFSHWNFAHEQVKKKNIIFFFVVIQFSFIIIIFAALKLFNFFFIIFIFFENQHHHHHALIMWVWRIKTKTVQNKKLNKIKLLLGNKEL